MKALKDEQYTAIINSAIRATVHLCSFAESMYRLDNTMLAMCTISRYYQRNAEDNKPPCQSYGSGLNAVSLKVTTKLTRSVPESIG